MLRTIAMAAALIATSPSAASGNDAEEHVSGPMIYAMCGGSNQAGLEVYSAGIADALRNNPNSRLSRASCIPGQATPDLYAIAICRTVQVAPEITDRPSADIIAYSLSLAFPCAGDHRQRLQEIFPTMPAVVYETGETLD